MEETAMTVMEMLRQLFGNRLDEDISDDKPDDNKPTDDKKDDTKETVDNKEDKKEDTVDNNDNQVDTSVNNNTDADNKEEPAMDIFESGWYDETSGRVDMSKIKNPEVLSAIQRLENRYAQERDARAISDSLRAELGNYSLRVSEDTLEKMLDKSNIKVQDGKVTGVKEALEALKKSEPGIFIDKEKESNPLNEGFNPVEKKSNGEPGSFSEAFKLMEEIN